MLILCHTQDSIFLHKTLPSLSNKNGGCGAVVKDPQHRPRRRRPEAGGGGGGGGAAGPPVEGGGGGGCWPSSSCLEDTQLSIQPQNWRRCGGLCTTCTSSPGAQPSLLSAAARYTPANRRRKNWNASCRSQNSCLPGGVSRFPFKSLFYNLFFLVTWDT